jgi:alkylhydroperoxidase family enzyme
VITGPIIAEVAALVGDPARATMVSALLDGRALTASELAVAARVTPQTASTHLAKDVHAAVGSRNGVSTEKLEALLGDDATSPLFTDAEKAALEYADAITDTRRDVDDARFARLQGYDDDDTIAELTMIIAWENASARFNRAFRIPSQGFWKP